MEPNSLTNYISQMSQVPLILILLTADGKFDFFNARDIVSSDKIPRKKKKKQQTEREKEKDEKEYVGNKVKVIAEHYRSALKLSQG